jgi:hypothetical protein
MARDKSISWTGLIERALAMLAHAADDRRSWDSGLNTHDQREFRYDAQVGDHERAVAGIRESLDNLR